MFQDFVKGNQVESSEMQDLPEIQIDPEVLAMFGLLGGDKE